MSDTFEFKGDPVAKPRMTRADQWKKRPIAEKYWAFKDEIKKQAKEQGFQIGETYRVEFHVGMPKSWSKKKKREMVGQPHKQTPDVDNFLKSLNDCLLDDDSAVWYVVAVKKWAEKSSIKVENFPNDLDF